MFRYIFYLENCCKMSLVCLSQMAGIVTFPCEYLVVSSGYTGRLTGDDKIRELDAFCKRKSVTPLFVFDRVHGTGSIQAFYTDEDDEFLEEAVSPSAEEHELYTSICTRLTDSGIHYYGIIVFRVETFDKAKQTFLSMLDLDYCEMRGVDDIEFLANQQGQIDLVYVSIDAESG